MFCQKTKPTVQQDFEQVINLFFHEKVAEKITQSSETDENQVRIEANSEKKMKMDEIKTESATSNLLPNILFSFYYSHVDSDYRIKNDLLRDNRVPSNLHFISGFQTQLDYDAQVEQVASIFLAMNYLKVYQEYKNNKG
jgi:hypothetical protein